jgi:hypothetical protein
MKIWNVKLKDTCYKLMYLEMQIVTFDILILDMICRRNIPNYYTYMF